MLVCNVSLHPQRSMILAAIAEAVAATDATATGNIVFATLVDDPASVGETVDAYLGEIMLEAASAADVMDAGFAASVTIVEAASSTDTQDATKTSGVAATWNPADLTTPVVLSNGNLTVTTGGSATNGGVRSTTSTTTGKVYFEYTCTNLTGANTGAGIATSTANLATMGGTVAGACLVYSGGAIYFNGVDQGKNVGAIGAGAVLSFAIDVPNSLLWARLGAGNWNGSGTANPATGVGGISISSLFPSNAARAALAVNGASINVTANFGASSFAQSVPSGFTAWNSVAT
jgi:hypothetical protein